MSFYKAIHLTLQAHAGQVRKLDGDIYAAHPIEVGFILSQYDLHQDVIIAGILHDTLEDTNVTYNLIEKKFNANVAQLVKNCSEENKDLPWKVRKEKTIDYLENYASSNVKHIMCADKLSNLESIYRNLKKLPANEKSQVWKKFNAGYKDQKWYYKKIIQGLESLENLDMYQDLVYYFRLVFE